MQNDNLQGHWFYADYACSVVIGQYMGKTKRGEYLLKFRCGDPWRTIHSIPERDIHGEAEDPRLLVKLGRLINTIHKSK